MKKGLIATCLLLLTGVCFAQTTPSQKDQAAIRQVMADQVAAWNKGSVDEFMKGYWNNDSLIFIGKSGISYGYRQALHNYRKNYSTRDQMGTLFFTLVKIKRLSPEYSFVIGKWMLKRKVGDIGGIYTLLFRKIEGQWMIVVDHTS
jgi:ketosteroid isomerase-like protein